ncbi:MAG: spore maturation protein [Clostridioides sp.]|nr:spore maturation protein [Clostridioides sp.]
MAKIWFYMIVIGIVGSLAFNNLGALNGVILSEASNAIEFAISLAGIMAIWMGLMNIASEAGLIEKIGNKLGGVMKALFPKIPKGHKSIDYMVMNIVMNMLGAGNGATAFGLKAMDELQTLNHKKDTATDEMIMFLVVNISSLQIIPFTIIKLRMDMGSVNPSEIIFTTVFSTLITTFVAIGTCRLFQKRSRRKIR